MKYKMPRYSEKDEKTLRVRGSFVLDIATIHAIARIANEQKSSDLALSAFMELCEMEIQGEWMHDDKYKAHWNVSDVLMMVLRVRDADNKQYINEIKGIREQEAKNRKKNIGKLPF